MHTGWLLGHLCPVVLIALIFNFSSRSSWLCLQDMGKCCGLLFSCKPFKTEPSSQKLPLIVEPKPTGFRKTTQIQNVSSTLRACLWECDLCISFSCAASLTLHNTAAVRRMHGATKQTRCRLCDTVLSGWPNLTSEPCRICTGHELLQYDKLVVQFSCLSSAGALRHCIHIIHNYVYPLFCRGYS